MLGPRTLKTLYYSLIHCHLIYCIQVVTCGAQKPLQNIFKLQKKAIRIITGSKYNAHTAPLFKDNSILPYEDLAVYFKLLMLFDYKSGYLPKSFDGTWSMNTERNYNISLRNDNDFHVPTVRFSFIQNHPWISFAKYWNDMEKFITSIQTRRLFKDNLLSYFFSKLDYECSLLYCHVCSSK